MIFGQYKFIMKKTSIQLQKAYFQVTKHALVQQKIQDNINRKNTSRRTIKGRSSSSGGSISKLRFQIKAKEKIEQLKNNKKAKRQLSTAINKYKESFRIRGVTAKKANKIRFKEAAKYWKRGEEPPPELLILDRESDKELTAVKAVFSTEKRYPGLWQAIQKTQVKSHIDNDDVDILLKRSMTTNKPEDIAPLSPNITKRICKSDSVDSIRGGNDYVSFDI